MKEILPKRLNQYGFKNQAEAARICFEAKELYGDLFQPISFKNGLLTILVKNAIEAQQIQAQIPEIRKKINQKIAYSAVKKLKFRIVS